MRYWFLANSQTCLHLLLKASIRHSRKNPVLTVRTKAPSLPWRINFSMVPLWWPVYSALIWSLSSSFYNDRSCGQTILYPLYEVLSTCGLINGNWHYLNAHICMNTIYTLLFISYLSSGGLEKSSTSCFWPTVMKFRCWITPEPVRIFWLMLFVCYSCLSPIIVTLEKSVFLSLNYFISFLERWTIKLSSSNSCGSPDCGTELIYSDDSERNLSSYQ